MYLSYFFLWCAVGDNAFLTMSYGQVNAIFWPSIKAAQAGAVAYPLPLPLPLALALPLPLPLPLPQP